MIESKSSTEELQKIVSEINARLDRVNALECEVKRLRPIEAAARGYAEAWARNPVTEDYHLELSMQRDKLLRCFPGVPLHGLRCDG